MTGESVNSVASVPDGLDLGGHQEAGTASSCCTPVKQASCCEPAAKASCCGAAPAGTCGCQSGGTASS